MLVKPDREARDVMLLEDARVVAPETEDDRDRCDGWIGMGTARGASDVLRETMLDCRLA